MADVVLPFSLNILSAAAFTALSAGVRTRLQRDERAFAARLAGHLRRHGQLDIDVKLLQKTIFAEAVWLAMATGGKTDSEWDHLLFDLVRPGSDLRGRDIGPMLSDAFREASQREFALQLRSLDDLDELKSGQAVLYDEIKQLSNQWHEWQSSLPDESSEISSSIGRNIGDLDETIKELTDEQMYVLRALHGLSRALIPGCAGSGKTIVAAEKAIRVDRAGLKTLVLCHNPYLASHLRQLTTDSMVEVMDFNSWIHHVIHPLDRNQLQRLWPAVDSGVQWNRYLEPTQSELENALDILVDDGGRWDAVIVDEGQDFRSDWWQVIDAALRAHPGILYIFADDDQRILERREYSDIHEVHALSRNCRNSGAVYRAMRTLVPGLPEPEGRLGGGRVTVHAYREDDIERGFSIAARSLDLSPDSKVVVLTADHNVERFISACRHIYLEEPAPWRQAIISTMQRLAKREFSRPRAGQPIGHTQDMSLSSPALFVDSLERRLSHNSIPTEDDRKLVSRAAGLLWDYGGKDSHRYAHEAGATDAHLEIVVGEDGPTFETSNTPYLVVLANIVRGRWASGLYEPNRIRLIDRRSELEGGENSKAVVYTISEFKGLEADNVLLAWDPRISGSPVVELYVAISRARHATGLVVAEEHVHLLPEGLRAASA